MRGLAATTLLVLALSALPASALPFLQYGVDAARTGATADPGPASLDVAFNTSRAEGGRPWLAFPVIVDGAVFSLYGPDPIGANASLDPPGPAFIERVDLATATASTFVHLSDSGYASGFGSDGERLFVVVNNDIHALDLTSSQSAWPAPHRIPGLTASREPVYTACTEPVLAGGVLYLGCHQVSQAGKLLRHPADVGGIEARPLVIAIDARSGQPLWTWTYEPHWIENDGTTLNARAFNVGAGNLVLGGGRLFFVGRGFPAHAVSLDGAERHAGVGTLFALDARDGSLIWQRGMDLYTAEATGPVPAPTPVETLGSGPASPALALTPDELYVKVLDLRALDPATGADLWSVPLSGSENDLLNGHALAVFADTLFATSYSTLLAIDVRTHAVVWQSELPEGESWSGVRSMVVAGGRVHAVAESHRIFVFDGGDGMILEQRELPGTSARFGLGEGVLAVSNGGGGVTVLGKTAASIAPTLTLSDTYPAPGAPVTLDLSETRPGVLSDTFEARIDWGDGVLTPWSQELVHTHTYATAADRTITVRLRNSAGQEANAALAVHVGATPPRELNLVQKAFDRDNQDLTFGVLGVAIALGGGLVAVTRQRTRRRRVQRELDGIDHAYATTREHPLTCEAALAERLAHVRGLSLDGKLDQAEMLLLERRIVELRQALRLESIDEQFGFLTVNMARSLREMLADGRISQWEREHFLAALDEDAHLTRAQKTRVREQIEAWFARDATRG